MKSLIRIALVALAGCQAVAQQIPTTEGKTLDDKTVSISREIAGKRALLIVTFSKAAGEKAAAWTKALQENGVLDGRVAFYQIAHLQEVPRLFRGMAVSGISRGLPKERKSTFVILTTDLDAWNAIAAKEKDELPSLLLIGASGNIEHRVHAELTKENLRLLLSKIPR